MNIFPICQTPSGNVHDHAAKITSSQWIGLSFIQINTCATTQTSTKLWTSQDTK